MRKEKVIPALFTRSLTTWVVTISRRSGCVFICCRNGSRSGVGK